MANIKIYIPTFVSDQDFNPARVNPRLFFYNGKVDCEPFLIEANEGGNISQTEIPAFPYFDHYSAEGTGSFPGPTSNSLLFLNETATYGTTPTASLYDEYWETYVNLLYDPKTRLLDASAIIPLADYNEMELNDIVQFRGNYFHLRAINEYDVKTGTCQIQLLGPILRDSFDIPPINCEFDFIVTDGGTTTTTTTSTTAAPTTTTTTSTTSGTTTTSTTTTAGPTTTTTTSTTIPLADCYTYSIQNNDLGSNLIYRYRTCGNVLVEDNIVPPDSGTPDFCALSGSVERQGGTNSWVLTEEAISCSIYPDSGNVLRVEIPTNGDQNMIANSVDAVFMRSAASGDFDSRIPVSSSAVFLSDTTASAATNNVAEMSSLIVQGIPFDTTLGTVAVYYRFGEVDTTAENTEIQNEYWSFVIDGRSIGDGVPDSYIDTRQTSDVGPLWSSGSMYSQFDTEPFTKFTEMGSRYSPTTSKIVGESEWQQVPGIKNSTTTDVITAGIGMQDYKFLALSPIAPGVANTTSGTYDLTIFTDNAATVPGAFNRKYFYGNTTDQFRQNIVRILAVAVWDRVLTDGEIESAYNYWRANLR